MNDIQRGIIILVKSALTGEMFSLPESFDIAQAYPLLVRHQLMPMAYTGAVHCGYDKTLPTMQRLFQTYCQCLVRVEGQMWEVKRIFAAFNEKGIDYMPLKGCKINALYPAPELRLMGDADILIRMEQYPQIRAVMQELGFAEGLESDHELIWDSKALHVELHKRLIPSNNKDYCSFFQDGWQDASRVAGGRHELSKETEFVFLFTHFAKHYRDGGIGCRHLVDLWVYRRAFPELNEDCIREQLAQMQLLEFYDNILRVMDAWFADAASDEKSDFITEYIFQSGSWGSMESHMTAQSAKHMQTTDSGKRAKFKQVFGMIFPALRHMQVRYPILRSAPVLLPFFWPVRWVTALLFRRKSVVRQYRAMQVTSPDKIENFQQALQYVGLG